MSTGALARKMVAAVADIDAVEKHGRNDVQKYAYVKAADVAIEVRRAFKKHGIAFAYSVGSAERWDAPTKSGGTMQFVQLHIDATFTDADTGESLTVGGIGWGSDTGDKAPYKAMTGALKYILRMNCLIPDESDPENDRDEKATPAGIPEERIAECLTWITSAQTEPELRAYYAAAYKEAASLKHQGAMKAYMAAKDARKKQLQVVA
jgi:hypothetical protein